VALVLAEVAVAATDIKPLGTVGGAVLLAAVALPGLMPGKALAENPPERATIQYKQLWYKDKQPGFDRISVRAPSAELVMPVGSEWSFSIAGVKDSVSGASPRAYTNKTTSGASVMHDVRRGYDGSVTYYQPRSSYTVSLSQSKEHDYYSKSGGLSMAFSSDDHNTTYNVGLGITSDRISNSVDESIHTRKHTNEYLVGITQALTRTDLLQINLGFNVGRGDFTDHYKAGSPSAILDLRPDRREQLTQVVRWNHHVESMGSTLRTTYRHYSDTWKLKSHTLEAEWVQPVTDALTLTPLLRYYSQSAAYFYVDPSGFDRRGNAISPVDYRGGDVIASADQRLSAFGAVTIGMRIDYEITKDLSIDARADWYKQRTEWRMSGQDSPNLDPFEAKMFQVGVKYGF
jgi:Protein of unknown function (DUF3570)